jgi:hypothetical protein
MSGLDKVSGMDEHITGWQLSQVLVLVVRVRYQHCKYMPMKKRGRDIAMQQCSASMTFWCGIRIRGSMPLTDGPDPEPAIFVFDLQDANKKLI